MAQYRVKPFTCEAHQVPRFKDQQAVEAFKIWGFSHGLNFIKLYPESGVVHVKDENGNSAMVNPGDWLVIPSGEAEFYTDKDSDFTRRFEPMPGGAGMKWTPPPGGYRGRQPFGFRGWMMA